MEALWESLAWLSDNVTFLLATLSGRSSFPKPLTPEREKELVERATQGDLDAIRRLVEHNLRLVAHIAKKYTQSGIDTDDLVSIGTIGLMKAVHTFRPEAGKLTTYASRCIENEILMQLRSGKKSRNNVSLHEPIGADKEGNQILLMDLLGTEPDVVAEEAHIRIESRRAIAQMNRVLDARERRVIALRYGLFDGTPHAQHEVADQLAISRSYVSRIEKKALAKLRAALEARQNPRT